MGQYLQGHLEVPLDLRAGRGIERHKCRKKREIGIILYSLILPPHDIIHDNNYVDWIECNRIAAINKECVT